MPDKTDDEGIDKYAVEIDPDRVDKEKQAGKGASADDPRSNVPLDPEKGTEPFEKRPEDKQDG